MQRLIGWLLGSVLLLYLAFTVYQQRAEIAALPWRLSWHPFACVVCLMGALRETVRRAAFRVYQQRQRR